MTFKFHLFETFTYSKTRLVNHNAAFLIQLFLRQQKIADVNCVIHKSRWETCQSRWQILFLSFNFKSERKKDGQFFADAKRKLLKSRQQSRR